MNETITDDRRPEQPEPRLMPLDPELLKRDFLTPQEIAKRSGVTAETVKKWMDCGELPSTYIGGEKSHRKVPIQAYLSFLEQKTHEAFENAKKQRQREGKSGAA